MSKFFNKQMILRLVIIAIAIAVGICAVKVLRPRLTATETYTHETEQLDIKRDNVSKLVTASSVTSALISAIPEDTATPIANQLAAFSNLFIIIMTFLLTEKYLLTIFGSVATYMIVLSCAMTVVYNLGYRKEWLYNTIIKVLILALAFATFIPVTIRVTDMIEENHKGAIDNAISEALKSEEELREAEAAAPAEEPADEKESKLWGKVTGVFTSIGDAVTGAVDYASQLIETAKKALGNYVQVIAVMFVTSCVIPILMLLLYIFVFKYLFGLNFNTPNMERRFFAIAQKRQSRDPQPVPEQPSGEDKD